MNALFPFFRCFLCCYRKISNCPYRQNTDGNYDINTLFFHKCHKFVRSFIFKHFCTSVALFLPLQTKKIPFWVFFHFCAFLFFSFLAWHLLAHAGSFLKMSKCLCIFPSSFCPKDKIFPVLLRPPHSFSAFFIFFI